MSDEEQTDLYVLDLLIPHYTDFCKHIFLGYLEKATADFTHFRIIINECGASTGVRKLRDVMYELLQLHFAIRSSLSESDLDQLLFDSYWLTEKARAWGMSEPAKFGRQGRAIARTGEILLA